MSLIDDLISEVRELRKEVAGLRQQRLRTLMPATVKSVEGARVTATLSDDGEDGPVETPPLRIAQTTGKRGGGVSKFTKFGVGDTVLVVSPEGDVTSRSAVLPWVDTDDDPAPGSAEQDGEVIESGNAKIELKDGLIRLTCAGTVIELGAGGITANGEAITLTGAGLTHNGKNVGSTHRHGGVLPGAAQTAEPA